MIKRRILSMFLALAVVMTFMPMVTLTADAASGGKAQLVKEAKYNSGDTVKYTYNKKGLVKKSVSTYSENSVSSYEKYTTTTTYKYNKKNKISKKTSKDVTTETNYKTDNTTGKKRKASKGTVTTTRTAVTTFKYNKKGLATQAVTSSNYVKAGSEVSSHRYLDDAYKLTNGQYRDYYDDHVLTAAEIAARTDAGTSTTAYKNNGNGTYTVTHSGSTAASVYKDSSVTTVKYSYDKKKRVKKASYTTVSTDVETYTGTSGYRNVYTAVSTNTFTEKYSYDKKGRLKKLVRTNPNIANRRVTDADYYSDGSTYISTTVTYGTKVTRTTTENGKVISTSTDTIKADYPDTSTYTYKYDKNGNLKSSKSSTVDKYDVDIEDEVYDDVSVYFINAQGYREHAQTAVSTVRKTTSTFTNTVKKGTKALLTKLGVYKGTTDGYNNGASGSYSMDKVKFKLKAKKVSSKLKKLVEAQQWMIQNGVFCGTAGLR